MNVIRVVCLELLGVAMSGQYRHAHKAKSCGRVSQLLNMPADEMPNVITTRLSDSGAS